MTIRFRSGTHEVVDDDGAAQRIYMGSALAMEPGELTPIPTPMYLPASCASHVCSRLAQSPVFSPHPSAPSYLPQITVPTSADRSLRLGPTAMLETTLLFPILLFSYHSTNTRHAVARSVTLGIRLSFHVHDLVSTRLTCASTKPAVSFSPCISFPAAVRVSPANVSSI